MVNPIFVIVKLQFENFIRKCLQIYPNIMEAVYISRDHNFFFVTQFSIKFYLNEIFHISQT